MRQLFFSVRTPIIPAYYIALPCFLLCM